MNSLSTRIPPARLAVLFLALAALVLLGAALIYPLIFPLLARGN